MSARKLSKWLLVSSGVSLALGLAACLNNAVVVPLSPAAQGVRVASAEPPPGAHLVGPISATHGEGCGITHQRGTEAGATAALREAAARRGITFVKLTKTITPYPGHDCFHQEYTLEGLGYSFSGSEPAAPASSVLPPVASVATPVVAVAPSAAVASAPAECSPPCSPGYACHAGVCEAECNPPCAADQTCRADRVCVSRVPTP